MTARMIARAALVAAVLTVAGAIVIADEQRQTAILTIQSTDTPEARVASIVERLSSETLEQSFENAAYVDDYYWPGYISNTFFPGPFVENVKPILSNRRFAKLYSGIKPLSADEQHALLSKYFAKYLAEYRAIVPRFKLSASPTSEDYDLLIRISEVPGKPRTANGLRHGLRAIALLSGMTGNSRMWPILKEAFKDGAFGIPVNEAEYEPEAFRSLKWQPLFSEGFQADVAWLMARYSEDAAATAVGLDRKAVVDLIPAFDAAPVVKSPGSHPDAPPMQRRPATMDVDIPDYRARVTAYDIAGDGQDDLSRGFHTITFLVTTDSDELKAVARAAGL